MMLKTNILPLKTQIFERMLPVASTKGVRPPCQRIFDIVPDISVEIATELIPKLLNCPDLDVHIRYLEPHIMPPGKDGYIEHNKGRPDKAYVVVRDDIPDQHKIWVIGHEILHHKQRYDLWPPEEEFVEDMELVLMYALRGIYEMSREREDSSAY